MLKKSINLLKKTISELIEVPQYYVPYLLKNGRANPPTRVDFELTYTCNLKCSFCPQAIFKEQSPEKVQSAKNELSTDEIYSVIDELKAGGVPLVTLTGGEPFVRKDIMDIVTYIKQKDLELSILSNGALITKKKAEELVRLGVDTITFSLDGPEALHDEVRGIPKTFSKMTKIAEHLIKTRVKQGKQRPYINFNCTISALNQSAFSEIIDAAVSIGIDSVSFGFLFFTNEEAISKTASVVDIKQAKEEDQVLPDKFREVNPKEIEEQMERCREKAEKSGLNISFNPALDGKTLEKYFYDYRYSYTNKCFFPWKVARVNPDGTVYPCSIDISMGNLKKEKFFEIWNGKKYVQFRKTLKENKLFEKCNKCCELQSKVWSALP